VPITAGGSSEGSEPKDGRQVFNSNNCTRCHSIDAGRRGRAPNLSKVGSDHDADWIAAHVRDPKSHNARSGMPKYDEARINDTDLKTLAEFLASLK
jgi:cbb3-type cytochrome oxidase cytochrome c subunit